jgi:F-type H+-transporting ATPase subunit beta
VRFPHRLLPICSLLLAGNGMSVALEVLSHPDEKHVRGIALAPTQGLARGMAVTNTDGHVVAGYEALLYNGDQLH